MDLRGRDTKQNTNEKAFVLILLAFCLLYTCMIRDCGVSACSQKQEIKDLTPLISTGFYKAIKNTICFENKAYL